jgi:sortase A
MVVEIGSVVGLFIILGVLVVSLADVTRFTNELQADTQRTLQALQIPATATPTINMARVVLPGGHRYDANTNLASFALDEVPAQYRDAYQQFLSIAKPAVQPTQSPESPLNIRIPALGVKSVVVPGDSWEDLKRGVGHHYGSANPGEKGNLVLTAHNDVYGEIFRDLEKLRPGDKIYIATQSREYVYVMRASEVVLPTEVRVLENTQRTLAQITLITCTPYRVDTHRYIVYGELEPQS